MCHPHQNRPSLRLLGLIPVLLFLAQGCDPGFSYRPEGWRSRGYQWVSSFHEVGFTTWGITGILGDESITPEFEISNKGSTPVVLESAELWVDGRALLAHLPGRGEARWRTVAPGAVGRITLLWSFNESAHKVLGSRPKIVLKFQQGARPLEVVITYTRTE
jgi:hypothetical protein